MDRKDLRSFFVMHQPAAAEKELLLDFSSSDVKRQKRISSSGTKLSVEFVSQLHT